MDDQAQQPARRSFASHPRNWRDNRYVYPVISRRAGGLSIGINLAPDKRCNFRCVYCQVDRTCPGASGEVDLRVLRDELQEMVRLARSGDLFNDASLRDVPPALRRLRDIAFSGDGEPTISPAFADAVRVAVDVRRRHATDDVWLVLITNSSRLAHPALQEAINELVTANGQIWAKLDAGTEDYFRQINRAGIPLRHILANITHAARRWPLIIQSLWVRIDDVPPADAQVSRFADRLVEIGSAGGMIQLVQLYTVARPPAERFVSPLTARELDHIAELVRARADVAVAVFA